MNHDDEIHQLVKTARSLSIQQKPSSLSNDRSLSKNPHILSPEERETLQKNLKTARAILDDHPVKNSNYPDKPGHNQIFVARNDNGEIKTIYAHNKTSNVTTAHNPEDVCLCDMENMNIHPASGELVKSLEHHLKTGEYIEKTANRLALHDKAVSEAESPERIRESNLRNLHAHLDSLENKTSSMSSSSLSSKTAVQSGNLTKLSKYLGL